jgi:hypothetical protein
MHPGEERAIRYLIDIADLSLTDGDELTAAIITNPPKEGEPPMDPDKPPADDSRSLRGSDMTSATVPLEEMWATAGRCSPAEKIVRTKTRHLMLRHGIRTAGDLERWSPEALLRIPTCGPACVEEARRALGRLGLALAEETDPALLEGLAVTVARKWQAPGAALRLIDLTRVCDETGLDEPFVRGALTRAGIEVRC